jgi:hypothetical protein
VFQRKASRLLKGEDRNKVSSRSVGLDTGSSQPAEGRVPPQEGLLCPSRECWTAEDRPAQAHSFSRFSSRHSGLRELDDGQFDQEDGVTQVTCMWATGEATEGFVNRYSNNCQHTCMYVIILWIFPNSVLL